MEQCDHPRVSIVQGLAKCDVCALSWWELGPAPECMHRWVQDNLSGRIHCSFCGADSASEDSK